MSIIYDALQKVEDKDKTSPAPEPQKRSKNKSSFVVALAIFGILFLGLLTFSLFKKIAQGKSKMGLVKQSAVVPPAQKELALQVRPEDAYIVEGIVYSSQDPMAIINGKIVKVKDTLGDFEVISIAPEGVSLRNIKDNTTLNLFF